MASPDALLLLDRHGVIDQVSGDFLGMLGFDARALEGSSIRSILDQQSADYVVECLAGVIDARSSMPAVVLEGLTAVRSDGTPLPVEALVVVMKPDADAGDSVLVTLRDDRGPVGHRAQEVAVRERLESSNRDLEAFASVAAHDLQEPLRKIRAFSDRIAIALENGDPPKALEFLERVDAAAARMQTLLDDLLELARITGQQPDRRPVDLGSVARDVARELAPMLPQVHVEIGDIPRVAGDPVRMRQLVANLLGNAIKYRRPDVSPEIEVIGHRVGDFVEVTVTDNGIGFEDQYRERIFGPFQRLHGRSEYPGTGVGLALCRAIVERHGGSLVAQGRPGVGATFTVTLPASEVS